MLVCPQFLVNAAPRSIKQSLPKAIPSIRQMSASSSSSTFTSEKPKEFDHAKAEAALYAEFPHLFWKHKLTESGSSMTYGLCIGPGWFPILRELCVRITKAIDVKDLTSPKATVWGFNQVKEKFAGLRVYGPTDNDGPISEAYAWAEKEANKTCETCGGEGSLWNRGGWYVRICQECVDEQKNNGRFSHKEWTKIEEQAEEE